MKRSEGKRNEGHITLARALVTGAAGFLGGALARFLRDTHLAVDRFDCSYDQDANASPPQSVLDPAAVDSAVKNVDLVFHLAGILGTTALLSRNAEAIDINIKGTVNVLDACLCHRVHALFYPTKPNEWLNTYSITKKAAEGFIQMYARLYGLNARILRLFNVYGPGQRIYPVRKAVPVMVIQGLYSMDIEVYGNGEQPVFLTYVDDVVRNIALYTLDQKYDATIRDTGNSIQMSVNEMAGMIRRLTKSKAGIRHLPMRAGEDVGKIIEPLPGPTAAATTPIESGMSATVEHYAKLPPERLTQALKFYYGTAQ